MEFKFQMYLGFASPGFGLHVLASKPQCQGSDHYSGAFVTTGLHRPYLAYQRTWGRQQCQDRKHFSVPFGVTYIVFADVRSRMFLKDVSAQKPRTFSNPIFSCCLSFKCSGCDTFPGCCSS